MDIKILLFPLLLLNGCSVKQIPFTLPKKRSHSCQNELKIAIATLTHAKKLSISSDIFSENPYLYLSNKKDSPLSSSPIFNDLNGQKKLLLYKEKSNIYIGLVRRDNKIQDNRPIYHCQ